MLVKALLESINQPEIVDIELADSLETSLCKISNCGVAKSSGSGRFSATRVSHSLAISDKNFGEHSYR
jgi:hypothetical protein